MTEISSLRWQLQPPSEFRAQCCTRPSAGLQAWTPMQNRKGLAVQKCMCRQLVVWIQRSSRRPFHHPPLDSRKTTQHLEIFRNFFFVWTKRHDDGCLQHFFRLLLKNSACMILDDDVRFFDCTKVSTTANQIFVSLVKYANSIENSFESLFDESNFHNPPCFRLFGDEPTTYHILSISIIKSVTCIYFPVSRQMFRR